MPSSEGGAKRRGDFRTVREAGPYGAVGIMHLRTLHFVAADSIRRRDDVGIVPYNVYRTRRKIYRKSGVLPPPSSRPKRGSQFDILKKLPQLRGSFLSLMKV